MTVARSARPPAARPWHRRTRRQPPRAARAPLGLQPRDHATTPVRAAPGLPVAVDHPAPAAAPPGYLTSVYWWAYVHPRAVDIFEREWLVNTILFGNYARLRDRALDALGRVVHGRIVQVACVYGNLTRRLLGRLAPDARLEVVDILPIQLRNLRAKLPADPRVALTHADASAMPLAAGSADQVLLFFLLHEQPEPVRRATLAEVMRIVKPGGRVVIVDYHRPSPWHPMRALMRLVFRRLEPYAIDLWQHPVEHYLPSGELPVVTSRQTFFGGLYQMLVLQRPTVSNEANDGHAPG